MSSFQTTNFVFNITNENNSFSITIPGHWNFKIAEKTIDELNIIVELRSQIDTDLHVEQVRKKRISLINDYSLSTLGTFKNEKYEQIKNAKYNDLEHMVCRMQLTCNEIMDT